MLQLLKRKSGSQQAASTRRRRQIIEPKPFEPAKLLEVNSDPLDRCVQLGRVGYLLAHRNEWKDHPAFTQICRAASRQIDESFAIVPEGFVSLPRTVNDYPGCPEETVETDPFLLARHPVTNAQFQNFVIDGGYEQLELWPKDIWPHLIDFKDHTDQPGPRYWQESRHNKHLSDHPVVGICYYEAAAFARWAGYRLPSEAEWQMSATWRIRSAANVMRRYPWGDALDTQRCNIWSSGLGQTVSVDDYPEGAAPNHVFQLIGNVWEWTETEYSVSDDNGAVVISDMRMSSIRGGAFDTYFPAQATGTFRTGLISLARVHNVGFRCALDVDQKRD